MNHQSISIEEKPNQFKEYFENQEQNLIPVQKSTVGNMDKFQEKILGKKDVEDTSLDIKVNSNLSGKFIRRNSKFLSSKEIIRKDIRDSLKKIGVIEEKVDELLTIRNMPNITEEQFNKIQKEKIEGKVLDNLFQHLKNVNCNFKSTSCLNSVGGINPLTYLIESSFHMNKEKEKEIREKYNLLGKYFYNYRNINGDGNCFYRAAMFRYIEILILTENIDMLKRFIYDLVQSFESEEIKNRRVIKNIDVKPDLTLKILFLILKFLKQKDIVTAHQLLVKCISTCKKFDYCLILYFRYILYKYIKENENKIYMKSFPVKIGNLLPSQYESNNGEFLFNSFYEEYLLKIDTDAEKIIIYLTPFVLGIELDIVVYDIIDEEILQKFLWEGTSDIKIKDVISLLNIKNHYEIIYTEGDNIKYKKIFELYETNIKSIIINPFNKSLYPNLVNYELDDKSQSIIGNINLNFNKKENNNNNTNNNKQKNYINDNQINKNDINNDKNILNAKTFNKKKNNNAIITQKEVNSMNIKNDINNNNINAIQPHNKNHIPSEISINKNNFDNSNNIKKIENNNLNNKLNNNNNKEKNNNKDNNKSINININNNINNNKDNNINSNKDIIINDNKDNSKNLYKNKKQKKNNIDNNLDPEEFNNNKNNLNINKNDLKLEINNENLKPQTAIMKKKQKINDHSKDKVKDKQERENKIKNETNLRKEKESPKKMEKRINKSDNKCIVCNLVKVNSILHMCKECTKKELIKKYYNCIQKQKDPKTNIYFIINNKQYNINEIIKLYNESFQADLNINEIIKNIEEKKCILCTFKNNIFLPCRCCYLCIHLLDYFKNSEFSTSFICPSNKKYSRKDMFILGIQILKCRNDIKDIQGIIKYFEKRLNKNCCLCNSDLIKDKFNKVVNDDNAKNHIPFKEEDINKFLSNLQHYLCIECLQKNNQKEFKCKICDFYHLLK